MGRFSRVSILTGLMLFPILIFAQFNNNTTSPYSRFGLGDLQSKSFGRTAAMGGATLASRNSQQINNANPASYTAVDSLVFLFEFGMNGKLSNYSGDAGKMDASDINFRYFSMNFQINNWLATSLGLNPYSDVGYDIQFSETVENSGDFFYTYFGEGSLSKAYLGFAIEPIKNVSLGANINYIFGSISHNSQEYSTSYYDIYNLQNNSSFRLSDFGLDFGLQATLPLKNKNSITFAAVLENKPEYTAFRSSLIRKTVTGDLGTDLDTLNSMNETKSSIVFPFSYGLGVSYVKDNKLEVNADYYHQSWSKAKFFGETNPILTDLDKFALGAEWIPDKSSIRSYLNKVAYRGGIKYEKSYLMLNNQQINDFGISFGIGLPIYRSNSTVNISTEVGRKGTKKNDLLVENYIKFNLSVNLYDIWFIKRRYD